MSGKFGQTFPCERSRRIRKFVQNDGRDGESVLPFRLQALVQREKAVPVLSANRFEPSRIRPLHGSCFLHVPFPLGHFRTKNHSVGFSETPSFGNAERRGHAYVYFVIAVRIQIGEFQKMTERDPIRSKRFGDERNPERSCFPLPNRTDGQRSRAVRNGCEHLARSRSPESAIAKPVFGRCRNLFGE